MKTEYKRRWVSALRSGEYEQSTGQLTKIEDDGSKSHCCLGVLCEITKNEAGVEVIEHDGKLMYDGTRAILPGSVADFVGLNVDIGIPTYNFFLDPTREGRYYPESDPASHSEWAGGQGANLHLASLNDRGLTFDQIADIIEWAEPED